jgi:hypothetical protein
MSKSDFISTAPIIVVPCANKKRYQDKYGTAEDSRRLPWWLIDAQLRKSGADTFIV